MQPVPSKARSKVMTGLDVLQAEEFSRLEGLRVGLITNHSALNRNGIHILELMAQGEAVELGGLFTPEHGFQGASTTESVPVNERLDIPVYSLFGDTLRPTTEMLEGIDMLVFDIQDIGVRFYTYISTMALCMEEAKKHDIPFLVLDRPNPITGLKVNGPIQDASLLGRFTSYFPLPVMHGMTVGELAELFNIEYGIQCDLGIVEMKGWEREMYYDETGLPWINPSPNIRNVTQEILYPGIALTEAANISVGRGTRTPFEWLGAPWIDGDALAAELQSRNLPGIEFAPVHFTPATSKFAGEECHGVRCTLTDRGDFMAVVTGIHLLDALYKLYPDQYEIEKIHGLVGKMAVIEMIKNRQPVERIVMSWQPELSTFIKIRNDYLLYKR